MVENYKHLILANGRDAIQKEWKCLRIMKTKTKIF